MRHRILFVDDEQLILQALQRMLRSMRDRWTMAFVGSGAEALALLDREPFDVLVTDMRMPGMNGAELLKEVLVRHPAMIRMVLSGHADQELVAQCVGVAHQYLSKPCDPERLMHRITCALEAGGDGLSEDMKAVVAAIDTLPSLPSLYLEIRDALEQDACTTQQLGHIIQRDMAMTAKILKLVNSTFFGLRRNIESTSEAVSYLGVETIKVLVLANGIFEQARDFEVQGFRLGDLWHHSLRVAGGAFLIVRSESTSNALREEAFVGGMLHDLGILVLATCFPSAYEGVVARASYGHVPLLEAENEAFKVTHTEVGAYLLGLWGIPPGIQEIARYHHRPELLSSAPGLPLLAVHTADMLTAKPETHPLFHFTRDPDEGLVRTLDAERLAAWKQLLRGPALEGAGPWSELP